MQFVVLLKPRAEKELAKLSKRDKARVTGTLVLLAQDPFAGKKLQGDYRGFWSLRVWPHRIIYYVDKGKRIVIIIRIGHRQGVY